MALFRRMADNDRLDNQAARGKAGIGQELAGINCSLSNGRAERDPLREETGSSACLVGVHDVALSKPSAGRLEANSSAVISGSVFCDRKTQTGTTFQLPDLRKELARASMTRVARLCQCRERHSHSLPASETSRIRQWRLDPGRQGRQRDFD